MKMLLFVLALLIGSVPQIVMAGGKKEGAVKDQAAIVAGEITAIANQLALRPSAAIDFTKISGQYCMNLGLGSGGHMTHYAADPLKNQEDVIDFVDARPLMKMGASFDGLPKLPAKLGAMKPNQWYFLPAGKFDPHHGKKFGLPMLVRATNVK